MEVILIQDVDNLGGKNEVVKVKTKMEKIINILMSCFWVSDWNYDLFITTYTTMK